MSVGPFLAQMLGERGIILPLDPLIAADEPGLAEAFFPYLLDHLRSDEGLFGLPVDANPVMLLYDPAYFAERGVPLVHENWDWDDLKESAIKLTQRDEEGEVQRWGLALMSYGYWWALWQNEADVADPATLRCLLQEPAAAEALQFCHDLIHKHRVAPPVTSSGSVASPPIAVRKVSGHGVQCIPESLVSRLSLGRDTARQGAQCAGVWRHGHCHHGAHGEHRGCLHGAEGSRERDAAVRPSTRAEGSSRTARRLSQDDTS